MGDNKNSFTVNRSRVGTMAQIGSAKRIVFYSTIETKKKKKKKKRKKKMKGERGMSASSQTLSFAGNNVTAGKKKDFFLHR